MIHVPRCVSGTKKRESSLSSSAAPCAIWCSAAVGRCSDWELFLLQCFTELSVQQVDRHGCLQVHPGAVEEEAVGCDAVPAARALLAVPPAVSPAPRPAPHTPGQSPQAGLQGQAR